jgi:hypothetical protein
VFQSELKALEMKRFLLKLTNKTKNFLAKEDFPIKEKEDKDEVVILENEFLKLDISKTKGKTLFLTNKKQNNLKIPLKLTLQYYIERGVVCFRSS